MSNMYDLLPPFVTSTVLLLLLSFPTHVLSSPQTHISTITVTSPPSTPSRSPEFASDSLFTSAVLNSTNAYRVQHSAPEVMYNSTLSRFATAYLSSVEDSCTFAHSGGPYGENLALGYPDVAASIDAWGDERRRYNFDKPGFGEETGHFTQLVWKNTTAVGCGRVECGEGKGWYLVCEYWPRGNVIGAFDEMVGRPVQGIDMGSGAEMTRAGWRACVPVIVAVWVFLS
ncbi:PR-1-like protein [Coniochaeta hoffmannii]|uniref:PR-1-like protein n=1 Tax=Coniochaeta hoffmannii TaxID=91930 RepID=A0AA38RQ58_9PEZI|nr:PR-1-like protein [Coniochaeta hoffmannii]